MTNNTEMQRIIANYREKIGYAESMFLNNSSGVFDDIKRLKKFVTQKGNINVDNEEDKSDYWKLFFVFYTILPYACLSSDAKLKKAILANQTVVEIPKRPLLKSFFTPIDKIIDEVVRLSQQGFEFDISLLFRKAVDTLTGNFIKQFQFNYGMTTSRSDSDVTFPRYLGQTQITMPDVNISEIDPSLGQSFIDEVKSSKPKRYRNLKDFILMNKPSDKHQIDFMFLDSLGIIKSEPIICRYDNEIILDFLKANKNLTNIIYPNYYAEQIEGLFKDGKNDEARNKIQRKYNYVFKSK